jgi:hypothetical protein
VLDPFPRQLMPSHDFDMLTRREDSASRLKVEDLGGGNYFKFLGEDEYVIKKGVQLTSSRLTELGLMP